MTTKNLFFITFIALLCNKCLPDGADMGAFLAFIGTWLIYRAGKDVFTWYRNRRK